MADTYGALQIPVQLPAAGEEISDPAVTLISRYLKAILNTYAQSAFNAVAPVVTGLVTVPSGLASPVVKNAFAHNPVEEAFDEKDLPSIYVYREGSDEKPYWLAEDYRVMPDQWTVLWLFRPAQQGQRKLRQSFVNAISKLVDFAIEKQRDPCYVDVADADPTTAPDPTAATTAADPDAIKTAIASSTSAQTYSGAALDGAIGATAFVPAQLPTVTITGTGGTGTIEFTGIGDDGLDRVSRVDVSGTGTFTGDYSLVQVTQIDVPAQADTGSTLTFGLGGWTGIGTNVFVHGSFFKLQVQKWEEKIIVIKMGDDSPPRSYEGIAITLHVEETWTRSTAALQGTSILAQFTDSPDNAYVTETALYS